MNTREAIIVTANTKLPVIDADPVMVQTTTDRDVALPEDGNLMGLWDTLMQYDIDALGEQPGVDVYVVVWSDDSSLVRFLCPRCDDVCLLADGAGEDLEDNTCAMVCCECLD